MLNQKHLTGGKVMYMQGNHSSTGYNTFGEEVSM